MYTAEFIEPIIKEIYTGMGKDENELVKFKNKEYVHYVYKETGAETSIKRKYMDDYIESENKIESKRYIEEALSNFELPNT